MKRKNRQSRNDVTEQDLHSFWQDLRSRQATAFAWIFSEQSKLPLTKFPLRIFPTRKDFRELRPANLGGEQ